MPNLLLKDRKSKKEILEIAKEISKMSCEEKDLLMANILVFLERIIGVVVDVQDKSVYTIEEIVEILKDLVFLLKKDLIGPRYSEKRDKEKKVREDTLKLHEQIKELKASLNLSVFKLEWGTKKKFKNDKKGRNKS